MRLSLLVITCLVICVGTRTTRAELLALYEGDKSNSPAPQVVLDSSGNGNHGVFMGSAGLVDNGVTGGALNFNADTSYMVVNTPATGAFDSITDEQAFTIGFWAAGGESNPRNTSAFWADGETPDGGNRAIQAHTTWSNSNVYLDIGGCCSGTQRLSGLVEEEYIKASVGEEWTHWAFTLDPEFGDARIYINGEIYENVDAGFFAERFGPTDLIPFIDKFYIGSDNNAGNQWEGRMDDFFVADEALSEAQISQVVSDGIRSIYSDLPAEPAEYTPMAEAGIRLENVSGQLGGAVYVEAGDGEVTGWSVEELFTTTAGGQDITVAADLSGAGVAGTTSVGDGTTSDLFGDVPLTNAGADDITRTFRLTADLTGVNDPVLGSDISVSATADIVLPGSGGGSIPEFVLRGDINQDGMIGFSDFVIFASNFGAVDSGGGVPSAPEPSSGLLGVLAFGSLAAARRRRK